jgi:hypothetical protein
MGDLIKAVEYLVTTKFVTGQEIVVDGVLGRRHCFRRGLIF